MVGTEVTIVLRHLSALKELEDSTQLCITAGVLGSWLACWSWGLYYRDVDRVGKEGMGVKWAWSELLGEP